MSALQNAKLFLEKIKKANETLTMEDNMNIQVTEVDLPCNDDEPMIEMNLELGIYDLKTELIEEVNN
jgi:hypothetical protein